MRALGLPLAIVAAAGRCAAVSECEFHVGMDIQVPAGLPGAGTELKVQKAGTLQAGLQNRFQNRFQNPHTPGTDSGAQVSQSVFHPRKRMSWFFLFQKMGCAHTVPFSIKTKHPVR